MARPADEFGGGTVAPPPTHRPSAAPLAPPSGRPTIVGATAAPLLPAAESNTRPRLAGAMPVPGAYAASRRRRRRPWSRARLYVVVTVAFTAISVAGWFGFRAYIYGDDPAPAELTPAVETP